MLKKLSLIFIVILTAIFCLYNLIKSNLLNKVIIKLVDTNDALGKRYINNLHFKFAGDKEQVFSGISEKYVLIADDGSKWLFKKSIEEDQEKYFLVYKLANILGIDLPETYRFSLNINCKKRSGYIMEFIPEANSSYLSELLSKCIAERKYIFIPKLLAQSVFGWLTYYYDPQLIFSASKVYFSDLDDSFYMSKSPKNIPDIFKGINIQVDYKTVYALLKYINRMDEKLLEAYLSQVLNSETQDKKYMIELIMQRKKMVVPSFFNTYSNNSVFQRLKFNRANAFSLKLDICNNLLNKIILKSKKPGFFKNNCLNSELYIVASGESWLYLAEKFISLRKNSYFKDKDVQALFQDCENKLFLIRKNAKDPREKLATTLYLRQLRTLKGYQEKNKKMLYPTWKVFIPILLETNSLKDIADLDKWFISTKYPSNSKVIIDKKPGEDEFILGLLNLINKADKAASVLFNAALEKGYSW